MSTFSIDLRTFTLKRIEGGCPIDISSVEVGSFTVDSIGWISICRIFID